MKELNIFKTYLFCSDDRPMDLGPIPAGDYGCLSQFFHSFIPGKSKDYAIVLGIETY
jgi:hypothetical protein